MVQFKSQIPARVRLLILGGGIHGVGVLHDMVTRGWKDVFLIEKNLIGSATSSRSTKLIHGGLRYLRNLRDFPLVAEALSERRLLMSLLPDLVKPIELLLPLPKQGGLPSSILWAGLSMYDLLAGSSKIKKFSVIGREAAKALAPILEVDKVRKIFSFWDAQTDDLGLVRRAAASAIGMGGAIRERCVATSIRPTEDGWCVEVETAEGRQTISALYVLNALGPWANYFLEASQLRPEYRGVNSEGAHILLPDVGLKAGLFLQDPLENRIFFVLPWAGHTLVGTTEAGFEGNPDNLKIGHESIRYLLERSQTYLTTNWQESDIQATFSGLRWLAVEDGHDLSSTSRAYVISEHKGGRGLLLTLYGGKLTTYRRLARTIGDRIAKHFGEFRPSLTHLSESWVGPEAMAELNCESRMIDRFLPGGVSYTPKGF